MALFEENCTGATCDVCNETYEANYTGFSLFGDVQHLLDNMGNDGWFTTGEDHPGHEDKYYCPKCHSFNDEDELIVKEKDNSLDSTKQQ